VPAILNRDQPGDLSQRWRACRAANLDGVHITKLDGTPVPLDIRPVTLQAEAAEKAGF
jgi:hypothetical protein